MLAKKPADRYQGGGELLADLRAVAKDIGGDADWEEWSTAEMVALAGDRAETTARLGQLMKTTTMLHSRRQPILGYVAAAVVAVCAGLALGEMFRPRPLLAQAKASSVPQKQTVLAQIYHAKLIDTPAAWQSVREYFDDTADNYHLQLADLGLGLYYYRKEFNLNKALPIFKQLAQSTEEEFAAIGYAYVAIITAHLGLSEQHNAAWAQLLGTENRLQQQLPRNIQVEVIEERSRIFGRLNQAQKEEVAALRREMEANETSQEESGNGTP
jgi:hypothetical protein